MDNVGLIHKQVAVDTTSSRIGHRHSMSLPPDGRVVPDGVFDLAQAQAAGWSLAALRHAITVGRIRRVRRGMYIGAEPVGSSAFATRELVAVNNAVAALRAVRGSTISHRSAALWHGLPVLDAATPCVTVAPGARPTNRRCTYIEPGWPSGTSIESREYP